MDVRTNLKSGDLGQDITRVMGDAARGAQDVIQAVGQAAAPAIKGVSDTTGRLLSDPNFWAWPFKVTR